MNFANNVVSFAWLCSIRVPWGAGMWALPLLLFILFFLRRLIRFVVNEKNTKDFNFFTTDTRRLGAWMQADAGGVTRRESY